HQGVVTGSGVGFSRPIGFGYFHSLGAALLPRQPVSPRGTRGGVFLPFSGISPGEYLAAIPQPLAAQRPGAGGVCAYGTNLPQLRRRRRQAGGKAARAGASGS